MTKSTHTSYSNEQLDWIRTELIQASFKGGLTVNKLCKIRAHSFNDKFNDKRTYQALSAKAYELVRHENLPIYLSSREATLRKQSKQEVALKGAFKTATLDISFETRLQEQLTHHKNIVSAIELLIDEL